MTQAQAIIDWILKGVLMAMLVGFAWYCWYCVALRDRGEKKTSASYAFLVAALLLTLFVVWMIVVRVGAS